MTPEEQLTLFQVQIQDIRDLKANQWRFSNYGLVIQAALVAVDTQLESISPCIAQVGLSLVSIAACGMILWLINEAQRKIALRRWTVDFLSEPLDASMRQARDTIQAKKEVPQQKPWAKGLQFKVLFFGVQNVGAVLALLVIWMSPT